MRSKGIEIEIKIGEIPQEILDSEVIDFEFSSHKGYEIMWLHDDGYKPFDDPLFDLIDDADSVYHRRFGTDHLDLYLETLDDIDEYGEEIEGIKYNNVKFDDWGSVDKTKLKTKKKIKE